MYLQTAAVSLFESHQYSSDQMKILKDQSAQTTARVVSVAYRLWLPFLINRVLNLTIPYPRNGVILYILSLCTYLCSNFIFVVPTCGNNKGY